MSACRTHGRLHWWAQLSLLGGACIAAASIRHHLSGPASASTIGTVSADASTVSSFDATPKPERGTYASFSYPAGLTPVAPQPLPAAELAAYGYTYRDSESWRLSITINRLAEPTLRDESGYALRKQNPAQYQESTMAIGDNTFVVMTDRGVGGFSKVAFLLRGNRSTDISLYGDDPQGIQNLQTTFMMVLHSWQWKN